MSGMFLVTTFMIKTWRATFWTLIHAPILAFKMNATSQACVYNVIGYTQILNTWVAMCSDVGSVLGSGRNYVASMMRSLLIRALRAMWAFRTVINTITTPSHNNGWLGHMGILFASHRPFTNSSPMASSHPISGSN